MPTIPDPEKAARVANETVRVYIEDQEAGRIEAAQSASPSIRERIRDLGPRTRVVAPASRPTEKSNPPALLILLGATLAGLGLGSASVLAREILDRRIRTPAQAVAYTGAECFGVFPKAKSRKSRRESTAHDDRLVHDGGSHGSLLAHVLDEPMSTSWRTLSRAIVALQAGGFRSLGVTAILQNEGTTTVATNLARLMSSGGARVLLVDANPQDGALSDYFGAAGRPGLIELMNGDGRELSNIAWQDERSGLHFLPIGGKPEERYRYAQAIWSDANDRLRGFVEIYDYVIFDLPPLSTSADARAAAELVDCFLLVVSWGASPEQVQAGLANSGSLPSKVLGSILSKVSSLSINRSAVDPLPGPIGHPLPGKSRRKPEPGTAPPFPPAELRPRADGKAAAEGRRRRG